MDFTEKVLGIQSAPLTAKRIELLQVNLGNKCNMACKHCHIGAGPAGIREMGRGAVDEILRVMADNKIGIIDITGGAPELNAHFRYLVESAGRIGIHVIVRTNLTIFLEEGMGDLPEFYERNGVEIIASFPYYTEGDVDRIRGKGTFQKSIWALKILNRLGYDGSPGKKINLVYNPGGAFLAPPQQTLERDFKRELQDKFGIFFDNLYAFTNMPIGRFRDYLVRSGNLERYGDKLEAAFNPATLEGLMCRYLVNVGWDGMLYDCDFNQVLGLGIDADAGRQIDDFDYNRLSGRKITVGEHCYACTAGQGST